MREHTTTGISNFSITDLYDSLNSPAPAPAITIPSEDFAAYSKNPKSAST